MIVWPVSLHYGFFKQNFSSKIFDFSDIFSTDIMLLDDPTSSLDTKTTQKILETLTKKKPWKKKTILLTTNNTKLLKYLDRVIIMDQGMIKYYGTYSEMQEIDEFSTYLDDSQQNHSFAESSKETVSQPQPPPLTPILLILSTQNHSNHRKEPRIRRHQKRLKNQKN